MAGDLGSELSRGGMVTKIEAAKIAVAAGTHMVIASGKVLHPLAALAGDGGTWFLAHSDPIAARKRWIAGTLEPRGAVIVDKGSSAMATGSRSAVGWPLTTTPRRSASSAARAVNWKTFSAILAGPS